MNDTIPSIAGIVDNDVDLATSKLCRLLDKRLDVLIVENVAGYSNSAPSCLVNFIDYRLCFFYRKLLDLHHTMSCCCRKVIKAGTNPLFGRLYIYS